MAYLFQSPLLFLTSQKPMRFNPCLAFPVNQQQISCSQVFRRKFCSCSSHTDKKAKIVSCSIPFIRNQVKTYKILVQSRTVNNRDCKSKRCLKATVFTLLRCEWERLSEIHWKLAKKTRALWKSTVFSPKYQFHLQSVKNDVLQLCWTNYCKLRAREDFIATIILKIYL